MDIVYHKRRLVCDVRRKNTRDGGECPPSPRLGHSPSKVQRIDIRRIQPRGQQPKEGGSTYSVRWGWWRGESRRLLWKGRKWLRAQHIGHILAPRITPQRAFYFSLVGGVVFGIVSTALLFRFLDSRVLAKREPPSSLLDGASAIAAPLTDAPDTMSGYDPTNDVFLEYFSEAADEEYQEKVRELVDGYPIEAMLPYIFEKDRIIAAFLVGIAKKESNWGKRVPVLSGQDCFNYWGYRGVRRMMGTGGHTCFNSRKDAVETVARRLETLAYSERLNTPEKMILWKCGFSCAGHSRESVKKWISDVDMYFSDLNYE